MDVLTRKRLWLGRLPGARWIGTALNAAIALLLLLLFLGSLPWDPRGRKWRGYGD